MIYQAQMTKFDLIVSINFIELKIEAITVSLDRSTVPRKQCCLRQNSPKFVSGKTTE